MVLPQGFEHMAAFAPRLYERWTPHLRIWDACGSLDGALRLGNQCWVRICWDRTVQAKGLNHFTR